MRKIAFFLALLFTTSLFAQLPKETPEHKTELMSWWTNARFGMFVHWGWTLYRSKQQQTSLYVLFYHGWCRWFREWNMLRHSSNSLCQLNQKN